MPGGGSIGDLFMRVLAQMDGFEATVVKEAEKAGDKAGLTMGQRMAAGVRQNGAKVLGATLAAGFAIAAKGGLELQNIQADIQAQTGATADEAAAAAKTINRVAGENRKSLQSVADTAIAIRQNMGAVGPVADKLLDRFTKFARVTKQDAAGAVADFDDILDAWGLTAEDAIGIQDKLLVSWQKYGGSITDNQKRLAAFAPALKAANLTIDDGIGLLNLFQASGVDSAAAVTGITKALSKIKNPEDLTRLIDDIIATEDPFKRAQKAADLFGVKAGAKMANALRPGLGALDDFKVTTAETADATDKAADVIDSTFTARIAKAISVASAQLREFGADFGPGLTGAAGLVTILSQLGGGKLVKGILGPLAGLGGALKTRIVAAIMSAIIPATVAGGLVGEATAEGMGKGLAGSKAMGLAQKGFGAVGKVWGSILGKATVLGALAVIGVELWQQLQELNARNDAQVKEIGTHVGEQIATGTLEALQQSRGALEKGISDLNGPLMITRGLNAGAINALQADLDKVNAAIVGQFEDTDRAAWNAARGVDDAVKSMGSTVAETGLAASASFGAVAKSSTTMKNTIAANIQRIKTAAHDLTTKLLGEAQALIDGYYDPIILKDELRVQKDEVAAAKAAVAATKAGTAQRRQAKLTLDQAEKALDQTRANLLASGQLSAKDQKAWLKDLKSNYKTATGAAKKRIGELILKIEELQKAGKGTISIDVNVRGQVKHGAGVGGKAEGGHLDAGEASWVGEGGNYRELYVPDVPGTVIPHGLSEALAGAAAGAGMSGGDININVGRLDRRTMADVRREMKVISDKRRKRW